MKISVRIGQCEIKVDDGNADEPATMRWEAQAKLIKGLVEQTAKEVVALHSQMVGDEQI